LASGSFIVPSWWSGGFWFFYPTNLVVRWLLVVRRIQVLLTIILVIKLYGHVTSGSSTQPTWWSGGFWFFQPTILVIR
jgi:hypothetical protein